MKNGKLPTLAQKKILQSNGLDPDKWLVVKSTSVSMEIVSRIALTKQKVGGKKPKTRKIVFE